MPRTSCRRGADNFSVPSDANRDLGIFLVFTGIVASVPAYYLFRTLVMHTTLIDWRKGAALGLLLVLAGLFLMAFTRRSFRVRDGRIEVRDGLVRRPIRYTWKSEPRIRLQSLEIERAGRTVESWQVMLVDGKYEYLLDARPNQHLESRCLAEFLAKSIGCPLVVRQDAGSSVQIEAADLDLPFSERVHRYPSLLGPSPERPDPFPIAEQVQGEKRNYQWGMMTSGLLTEAVGLFLVALAVSVIPLPGDREMDYSLVELARLHHDFTYFQVTGGLFLLALFTLFGYRVKLELTPDVVLACTTLWGVPTWRCEIPLKVLEEITTRGRSQGAFLMLVSDERIISLRIQRQHLAEYLAAELQYAVAGISRPAPTAGAAVRA